MIPSIIFYAVSALLIVSAIVVVTSRNLFTCALYLTSALSLVAALFVLLGADFLAAVQILLYVGGILVILIFAVMLTNLHLSVLEPQVNRQWVPALISCLGIVALVALGLKQTPFTGNEGALAPTTEALGHLLLGEMKLPFEVVSLILMAALVGAILFTKRETKAEAEDRKS